MSVIEWLKLPEAKEIRDLDDPSATLIHAGIIRKKSFLKRLYKDFYTRFKKSIPGGPDDKVLVELGSGGGFIKEVIPNVITSDVVKLPNVDRQFSSLDMPFENNTVDTFFMFNVLHHMSDPRKFFKELTRSLKIGGKAVMIEPANTLWSRIIHQKFHHERFDQKAPWEFKEPGRLSSANLAVSWIIFYRDREKFEKEFPALKIVKLAPHTPFRYLLSGGLSMKQLLPSFMYNVVKAIEMTLSPFNKFLGMFLTIEIEKVAN